MPYIHCTFTDDDEFNSSLSKGSDCSVVYSHSPTPTKIPALGARQRECLDFILAISLQNARSFSRFQYLTMLQLENLAYTMKTFILKYYRNQKRNRQYSLNHCNAKRGIAREVKS